MCDLCDKRYARNSDLKVHIRSHTGERPYSCNQCHKSYITSSHLRMHERLAHTLTGKRDADKSRSAAAARISAGPAKIDAVSPTGAGAGAGGHPTYVAKGASLATSIIAAGGDGDDDSGVEEGSKMPILVLPSLQVEACASNFSSVLQGAPDIKQMLTGAADANVREAASPFSEIPEDLAAFFVSDSPPMEAFGAGRGDGLVVGEEIWAGSIEDMAGLWQSYA